MNRHENPLKKKPNLDLHWQNAKPSEQASRLRGLETRYALNKQLIQLLDTYSRAAHLLHREYSATRAYPECSAMFFKSEQMANMQLVELREVQKAIQKELEELRGQLPLFNQESENER